MSGQTTAGSDSPSAVESTSAVSPASSVLAMDPGFIVVTPEDRQKFAGDVTRALQAAGVDTREPISLTVDSAGAVKAEAGTPQAEKIDAVFAQNPALGNTYQKICNYDLSCAIARCSIAEGEAMERAGSPSAKASVWSRFSGVVSVLKGEGEQETLADGQLTSSALSSVDGLLASVEAAVQPSGSPSSEISRW
ncbi:hypothetical protein [Telmatospirillum siberiense]|uniref:Uncharacterized protein n=1 Tax=Telmatospirillum siberiense TaxID=382514 RepID=A0A2N3PVH7_9PROT|nr:hypothetical protein [Telmatospirillum siberiense]PKU24405.1 hypothetical protein CWS72_11170 [Telmatospirillum siberiense]